MKATEQLKAEHEGIILMLRIVEKICQRLEAGRVVSADDLHKIVEFFRIFVDQCHHGKEEDLLFPALEKAGIAREHGPIGQMLFDHAEGRTPARDLAEAVLSYREGDAAAPANIAAAARNYQRLLTDHIIKENEVLFPMADAKLTEAQQDELYMLFEHLEETTIGAGKHEEFYGLLNRLERTYLLEQAA
jgi:hemerythrin-like domain-containing protein